MAINGAGHPHMCARCVLINNNHLSPCVLNRIVDPSGFRELPTDANFAWAKDSYSKRQRTISIWSSLATLRTRLWLAETKQTYPGGFTAAKQSVGLSCDEHIEAGDCDTQHNRLQVAPWLRPRNVTARASLPSHPGAPWNLKRLSMCAGAAAVHSGVAAGSAAGPRPHIHQTRAALQHAQRPAAARVHRGAGPATGMS